MSQNSDPTKPHFVWVRGVGAPTPQKWGELNYGVDNRLLKDGSVLATHQLSDALWGLPIDELAKLFPYRPPAGG